MDLFLVRQNVFCFVHFCRNAFFFIRHLFLKRLRPSTMSVLCFLGLLNLSVCVHRSSSLFWLCRPELAVKAKVPQPTPQDRELCASTSQRVCTTMPMLMRPHDLWKHIDMLPHFRCSLSQFRNVNRTPRVLCHVAWRTPKTAPQFVFGGAPGA